MNILITGGTGFIGSHLIGKLLNHRHRIILLKRSVSDIWRISGIKNKLTFYDWDKMPDFSPIFKKEKIQVIMHLSSMYLKHHKDTAEIEAMNLININMPSKLLDTAIRYKVKGFISTGTFFEYIPSRNPINENSRREAFNYYTATKLAFEEILKFYADKKLIKGVTLKLFSPYGEKDNQKIVRILCESIFKSRELNLTKGEQVLSFTYVEDIVDAYLKAMNFIASGGYKSYESFNIGNDKAYSLKRVIEIIHKISKKNNTINLGRKPYSPDEIMVSRCDNSKAKQILRWKPQFDISAGLEKTYRYYSGNKV